MIEFYSFLHNRKFIASKNKEFQIYESRISIADVISCAPTLSVQEKIFTSSSVTCVQMALYWKQKQVVEAILEKGSGLKMGSLNARDVRCLGTKRSRDYFEHGPRHIFFISMSPCICTFEKLVLE